MVSDEIRQLKAENAQLKLQLEDIQQLLERQQQLVRQFNTRAAEAEAAAEHVRMTYLRWQNQRKNG